MRNSIFTIIQAALKDIDGDPVLMKLTTLQVSVQWEATVNEALVNLGKGNPFTY